jgi:hypothetical protein
VQVVRATKGRASIAILYLALVQAFAGCVGEEPAAEATDPPADPPPDADTGLKIIMKGCREAGGVSVYDRNFYRQYGPPPPFTLADISRDVDDAKVASTGPPPTSGTSGVWHMSVVCDHASYEGQVLKEFKWGWVGVRIMPPPWDNSTIDRQYFVPDFSFAEERIVERMRNETHLHVSKMLGGTVERGQGGIVRALLDDEDHGVFDTRFPPKDAVPEGRGPMRLWFLVSNSHSHEQSAPSYRPLAIDVQDSGAVMRSNSHDTAAWFTHSRTTMHWPLPFGAGNVAGLLYEGLDRTMTWGPRPNVTLDKTWLH